MLFVASCAGLLSLLAYATYVQTKTWRNAFTLYTHAYVTYPDNAWAVNALAQCYVAQKEFAIAESLFREAIRLSPNEESIGTFAVFKAMTPSADNFNEAQSLAQQALAYNPHSLYGNKAMGIAALRTHQWSSAEAFLRKSISPMTPDPMIFEWLAIACYHQKKMHDAIEFLQKALAIDPSNDYLLSMLTNIERQL
jgi:tetratricopeptide (TPR) repeat protein